MVFGKEGEAERERERHNNARTYMSVREIKVVCSVVQYIKIIPVLYRRVYDAQCCYTG